MSYIKMGETLAFAIGTSEGSTVEIGDIVQPIDPTLFNSTFRGIVVEFAYKVVTSKFVNGMTGSSTQIELDKETVYLYKENEKRLNTLHCTSVSLLEKIGQLSVEEMLTHDAECIRRAGSLLCRKA